MKTYLLFTRNFSKALAEISTAGGHVTQKFTKTVFVANFPKPVKINVFKSCSIKPYAKLDDISALMVKSWKSLGSKPRKPKPAVKQTKKSSNSKSLPAAAFAALGKLKANFPPSGTSTPTSEKMTGNIALGIVFVSNKTAGGLEFSHGDIQVILNTIMASCEFLARAGGSLANITFHYEYQLLDIDAVPNSSCQDQESCEAVFRDPALKKMGYHVGYQGCVDYVNDLKTKLNTDWAYMAFATRYPMKEPAYAGGVRACLQFPQFIDWSSVPPTSPIFARLSCNIFGAADEGSGCNCDTYGVNLVPNNNCANCQGVVKTPCLMSDLNAAVLCPWTMGQLGWINPRPYGLAGMTQFGNTFQVMYRDVNNQISQMSWNANGGDWGYQNLNALLPSASKTGGDPTLTQYGSSLHTFYRDENNQLSYISFAGGNWYYKNLSLKFPQAAAVMGDPAIVKGLLNLVYQDANNHVSYMYYDIGGTVKWYYDDLNALLPRAANALSNPAIAKYGKTLQVVYGDVNGHVSQMTWDGKGWSYTDLNALLPQAPHARGEPCIAQYGKTLQIAYWDVNEHVSLMSWDGAQWTYQDLSLLLPQADQIESVPSMVSLDFDYSLHLVYRDVNDQISHMYFDRIKWNYEKIYSVVRITGGAPIDAPSITTFGNQLQVISGNVFQNYILLYWNGSWNTKKYYP